MTTSTGNQISNSALDLAMLNIFFDDTEQLGEEVQAFFSDLTNEQLNWKPSAKEWSVAECFEHLNTAMTLYFPRMREKINAVRAANLRQTEPFQPGWFARKFVGMIEPSSKRRIRTTAIFQPDTSFLPEKTISHFLHLLEELKVIIQQADGFDINRTRLASPATRLIRFSIGEAIWLHVAHNRRHFEQAKRVTAMSAFPGP